MSIFTFSRDFKVLVNASNPKIYTIEKRDKGLPKDNQVIDVYYILERGDTYKANKLKDILRTRLITINSFVKTLLVDKVGEN